MPPQLQLPVATGGSEVQVNFDMFVAGTYTPIFSQVDTIVHDYIRYLYQ